MKINFAINFANYVRDVSITSNLILCMREKYMVKIKGKIPWLPKNSSDK